MHRPPNPGGGTNIRSLPGEFGQQIYRINIKKLAVASDISKALASEGGAGEDRTYKKYPEDIFSEGASWRTGFRIPEAKRKKPPVGGFWSGAGGIRTLVQTRNNNAFYMLSFHLDFRLLPGRKLPSHSLASIRFR